MKTILFVDKCGEVKDLTIKHLTEDNLYKRANTTNSDGFRAQASWVIGTETYTLYGKTSGPSNAVNKYEFPPASLPETLYGHCLIVATGNSNSSGSGNSNSNSNSSSNSSSSSNNSDVEFFDRVISTSVAKWEVIYEGLFGGFEDISDEDQNKVSKVGNETNKLGEEDAYDIKIIRQIYKEKKSLAPTMPVTIEVDNNGYVRDGFVVSDHESEPDMDTHPRLKKLSKKSKAKEPKAKEPKAKEPKAKKEPKVKEPKKEPKAKVPKRKPISTQAPMYCSGDTEQELTADEYV